MAKKSRKEHAWQFREQCPFHRSEVHELSPRTAQGEVEADESLSQAAKRELLEEIGSELDVWQPGKVPAAHYGYKLPKATKQGQTESQVSQSDTYCRIFSESHSGLLHACTDLTGTAESE